MEETNTYSKLDATNTKVDAVVVGTKLKVRISSFTCYNPNAAVSYVQFFDSLATNVTLGSTVPKFVVPLPANGGLDGPCGPRMFNTAICYAVTTTPGGNTAPGNACVVQFDYF